MFHSKTKIVKWLYEMGRTWELLDDNATRWWNYKIQNHILSGRQSSWGTYKWIWERLYSQTFEETEKIFGLEKRNLFFPTNWFESCWRSCRPGLIDGDFVLKSELNHESRMFLRGFQYLEATQIETFGTGQWASYPWNYLISVIANKNIGAITRQTFEKVAFNKLLKCLKYSLVVAVNDDIKLELRGRNEWKIRDRKNYFIFSNMCSSVMNTNQNGFCFKIIWKTREIPSWN